jgi:CDP-glycerol glycerophosphotransferase (TagB/SpsB family)
MYQSSHKFNWRHVPRVIASIVFSLLTRLIPRTNSIWVIGGSKGLKYGDNSMHFFKYCSRYVDKRIVWLAWTSDVVSEIRADGLEAYRIDSVKGIWLGLRAKWHVFDVAPEDTGITSRGAHLLNLWHGVPLKDIRFLRTRPKKSTIFFRLGRRILSDKEGLAKAYFVHPNKSHVQHILDSFDLLPENIIYANLPRNAFLKSDERLSATFKTKDMHEITRIQSLARSGARIIGYFPTWRIGQGDKFLGTLDPIELVQINDFLRRHNCYMLTKWHDCLFPHYDHPNSNNLSEGEILDLRSQSNFIALPFEADLNSYLPLCGILITDYSSVFFDYLFLARPILFFAYDLVEYQNKFGLFFDYQKFVPGKVLSDLDGLFNELTKWSVDPDGYSFQFEKRRLECLSIFFEHTEGPDHIVKCMRSITDLPA